MFEHLSYDTILKRMLSAVPENIDKREGSLIMNALAPAAMEVYMLYFELESVIKESFADTQSRDYLIRRAKERGISPLEASHSIWTARITGEVEIGARFMSGELSFVLTEQTDINEYSLSCEQSGSVGNEVSSGLLPIDNADKIISCEMIDIKAPARDEEETEAFRQRFLSNLQAVAFGGNVSDYKEKALSISGVGGVKVQPVWNGEGTVKLIVVGNDNKALSEERIAEIQNIFDPVYGMGMGLAPIGHICTVESVKTANVNVSVNLSTDYTEGILEKVTSKIDEYFEKLVSNWSNSGSITVRISQIEASILDIEGVYDVSGTTINGTQNNLVLPSDTIVLRGEVDAQIT